MIRFLSVTALCMAAAASSFAAEMEYSYNVNNAEPLAYGFDKKEAYDVAILLNDPSIIGTKVKGFRVLLPVNVNAIENISGWMSTQLTLENKKNVPDICSVDGVFADDMLTVTFEEPYTVSSDGVYVGYSFNITNLEKTNENDWPGSPVMVVESDLSNGLFIHSSRTRLKWADVGAELGAVSTMVVLLEGDFGDSDAAISLPANSYVARGEEYPVPVTVVNHGQSPIREIGYSYTIGEFAGNGTVTLDTPIESIGDNAVVNFPIAAQPELGTFPFTFMLESVNGKDNLDPNRVATGELTVMPFVPVNRPLVEEYTGLNCGFCPRGYVAMEEMNRIHGDLFIGIAYHSRSYESTNAMVVMDTFPYNVPGYPYGTVNRMAGMNPSNFPFVWRNYRNDMPVADLDVTAEWVDSERTELRADATVRFVRDFENHDYRLAIALVADNLFNDSWRQSNYFAGKKPEGIESELWDLFINGGSKVGGLTFNDVCVYYKDLQGIDGSLPEAISAGEEISYSYSVKMEDVVNLKGNQFMNPEAKLHFVAIVLDGSTGYSVNSNKSANVELIPSGVESSVCTAEVINTVWHDLQGRKVSNPAGGIFVKSETLSDGTVRVSKVVVR